MRHSIHENFSREEPVTPGSNRSFGLVMAAALSILAVLNGWHGGRAWPWLTGGALLFLTAALLYPAFLNSLNRAWTKLGLLLHKVINPIVMGLVFFGAVLPTHLVMRAMRKDLLRLKPRAEADSYWIIRQPPGPAGHTMKDQF
jgi:hypothetical protein